MSEETLAQGSPAARPDIRLHHEGEKGTSVYMVTGTYQDGPDKAFAGIMNVQDSTGRLFGSIIDPEGTSSIIGLLKGDVLTFAKLYQSFPYAQEVWPHPTEQEPRPEPVMVFRRTSVNAKPISYRLRLCENGEWSGVYRTSGLTGPARKVLSHLTKTDAEASMFAFDRWDENEPSNYEGVLKYFGTEIAGRREELKALIEVLGLIRSGELPADIRESSTETAKTIRPQTLARRLREKAQAETEAE